MFCYFQHDVCKGLERQDFFRFSREFSKVVCDNIPTTKELSFIDSPEQQPAIAIGEDVVSSKFCQAMEQSINNGRPVPFNDMLLLPFKTDDGTVIAKVCGLDEYLLRKIGKDWLEGLNLLLVREFMLVKRSCVDSLTGLLSSLHLEEYLDHLEDGGEGVLMLLSIYPRGNSSFQAKKYQHRSISLLKSFIENRFPLYYLGQSCFAILVENCSPAFVTDFAPGLVNFLKREGRVRVHVASVSFVSESDVSSPECALSEILMKKAWAALGVAGKRGPFAFCAYSSIEDAAHHPLAVPEKKIVRWFKKECRQHKRFGLLQFDPLIDALSELASSAGVKDFSVHGDTKTSYLFLPEKDSQGCLLIAEKIFQELETSERKRLTTNCGISAFPFPCPSTSKTDILLNCRKALCHAAFLDPGALVVCDAVTFNISGDIYYGDGDLVRAVKEYKRGLYIDPEDANLLNSLGVCYAQMNRHKLAVDCFQRACKSESNKFMALYNLGLEQQIENSNKEAIASFSQALEIRECEGEEKVRQDIRFRLAVLCIKEGFHKRALEYLLPWYTEQQKRGSADKGLRYLGEAYYGIGKFRRAMKYLQQAMRYDEYDAEVLGLLGEIYLKENEGDDIGLRFCEKAVELSPDSPRLKVQLASAQIQCGDLQSAGKTLQSVLRNKNTRPAALVQKGILAYESGRVAEARKWLLKVETCPASNPMAEAEACTLLRQWKTNKRKNG